MYTHAPVPTAILTGCVLDLTHITSPHYLSPVLQTYVHWGLHEPQPGVFQWDGQADLTGFLRAAAHLDLNVILRPGPYVCAESTFGGLPYWLGSSKVGRVVRDRCSFYVFNPSDTSSITPYSELIMDAASLCLMATL